MPEYIPRRTGRCKNSVRGKPWRAKRRRDSETFYLGYYATRAEAVAVEKAFDKDWPKGTDAWGRSVYARPRRTSA